MIEDAGPMPIVIDDEETGRLLRELSDRTGDRPDEIVKRALLEQLQHTPPSEEAKERRRRQLRGLLDYFDQLPRMNEHLTDEEILGYDDEGHFD